MVYQETRFQRRSKISAHTKVFTAILFLFFVGTFAYDYFGKNDAGFVRIYAGAGMFIIIISIIALASLSGND